MHLVTILRVMKAVRFHEHGDPSVITVDDIDPPEIADNELLVQVKAAGLNPKDVMNRIGYGGGMGDLQLPKISGSDFAGIVAESGSAVDDFQAGDRVFGTGLHLFGTRGSFAESVAVTPDLIARLPESVGFEVGGGLGIVGVTAWRALVDHADLQPGDNCLIHGANGGVGHMAVQIAHLLGATTVGTIGPERSPERIEALGADTVVRYTQDDLQGAIRSAVPSGYDTIIDVRMDEYLSFDIEVANPDADIVVIGGQTGEFKDGSLARRKNVTVRQISVSNLVIRDSLPDLSAYLRKLIGLVESGKLRVEIARTYPFSEAAEAHRAMDESFTGKLVLVP